MLPIRLDEKDVDELFRRVDRSTRERGEPYRLHVDLGGCSVRDDAGFDRTFAIDPFRRTCLLEGLDSIGLSLQQTDRIAAWEAAHGLPPLAAR